MKRLKEELNGPTVTEIIQMHKNQTASSGSSKGNGDVLDEMPVEIRKNATSNPFKTDDTIALDAQILGRNR